MNDIGVVTPDPSEQSGFVGFVKQVDKSKVVVQQVLGLQVSTVDQPIQKRFGEHF